MILLEPLRLDFKAPRLNAFESIEAVPAAIVEEEPLKAEFWKQSDVLSPWNSYWTNAASEGGGLNINDPVFGGHWAKYRGLHWGLLTVCDPEEACNCERHNCVRAQLMIGHAAAPETSAKSLGIPMIVEVPPTPTPSEIDVYSWHWLISLICSQVRITGTPSGPGVP